MNDFKKVILVFDFDAINDVRNCLSECQYYHEHVNLKALGQAHPKETPLSLTDALCLLSKIKDKKVTFYFLKSKNWISIYSKFFNSQDALNVIIQSFENLNIPLLLCEMENEKIHFSICMKGCINHCYSIETSDDLNIKYDSFVSKEAFAQIISFLTSKYELSNHDMKTFLNSHSMFKDEYII